MCPDAGGRSVKVKAGRGFECIVFFLMAMMVSYYVFIYIFCQFWTRLLETTCNKKASGGKFLSLVMQPWLHGREPSSTNRGDIAACDLLTLALLPYCAAVPAVVAYLCRLKETRCKTENAAASHGFYVR